jgi:hypothetical protein
MGLVESSNDSDTQGGIKKSEFTFFVEDSLKSLVKTYGDIVIDYQDDYWGANLVVSFARLSSSC